MRPAADGQSLMGPRVNARFLMGIDVSPFGDAFRFAGHRLPLAGEGFSLARLLLWHRAVLFSSHRFPVPSREGRRGLPGGGGMQEARMRRTQRPGYSLIEVLWIMALVSFLLAGMGEILLRSFQAARSAEETAKKTAFLTAALEGLKTKSFASADLAPGEYGQTSELTPGGKEMHSEWKIEQPAPGLKKVEYGLYLLGDSGRAIRAALLISEALGF